MKKFALVASLLACVVLGWYMGRIVASPDIIITKDSVVVVRDTISSPPVFIQSPEIKINFRDIISPKIKKDTAIYRDSIKVENDSANFHVKHTLLINNKNFRAKSIWDVSYKPITKIIEKIIKRDSLIYSTTTKYKNTPFYADNWFYTTLASILALLYLILH